MSIEKTADTLGRILGKLRVSLPMIPRRKRNRIANLVAKLNRMSNRRGTGGISSRASKTKVMRVKH